MPREMPARTPDPQVICQDWLDQSSVAIMEGDLDLVVSMASFPFILRTSAMETVFEHGAEFRSDVENVTQALKGQKVTNFIRLVEKAHYLDEATIEGWHTTYTLRDATTLTPPYGSRMILRRIDKIWKVTEADHEIAGARFPMVLLRSAPGSLSEVWRNSRAERDADNVPAEPIYQVFINSLSETVHSDFTAWCNHFTFPHAIHYDEADHSADTPEDVRKFYEMIVDQMHVSGADRIIRKASSAGFLSEDRIFGYHDTIMVKGNETVFGPIRSRMMLTFSEGRWKCSSVTNSLSNEDLSPTHWVISDKLPTIREIQERIRK